ncbi:MAG TPA: hypothetical protein VFE89_04275 [Beijerinckiaceae bacterium]|jgi:hypothetical protein|nr:hypothetical protein [Beijerinckiaceae bacterium]
MTCDKCAGHQREATGEKHLMDPAGGRLCWDAGPKLPVGYGQERTFASVHRTGSLQSALYRFLCIKAANVIG